jgi:NAD(P)-dependent dehydrogenase (short-subunit alcohol dehydrogenase family)
MAENIQSTLLNKFKLQEQVAVITGGGGLLGKQHGDTIADLGGIPVLLDIDGQRANAAAEELLAKFPLCRAVGLACDITSPEVVDATLAAIMERFNRVDILINNAANNPKVEGDGASGQQWSRLESFPLSVWDQDIAVGLTGAFLCARTFGAQMAKQGGGVILNISSDLGLISPDQRLYRQEGLPENQQPVKPVTYSVIKSGLLGLTRYLATYWADSGVRSNAILPGGIQTDQDQDFVKRLSALIPMGRMAREDEYKAAVAFLVSGASSYMTGAIISMDGGRTCW